MATCCKLKPGVWGAQRQRAAPAPQHRTCGSCHHPPAKNLPVLSPRALLVGSYRCRKHEPTEPWSCHCRDRLADLAGGGEKKEQPKNVTSCIQIQGLSQPRG